MMLARRENLRKLEYGDHAGLAFQKLYRQHDEKGDSAKELLNALEKMSVSSQAYKTAFARWQSNLPENKLLFTATTMSALAIGLGNASPLEVGFTLHQTYGTPYLPGSAIKGLLTRAAEAHELSQEVKEILFGTTESAAHIVYWDAMLEPSSTKPFQQDVITVHHQKYYQGNGYPTDFDDPIPVPFLSVKSGITFCVALSSSSEGAGQWLYLAAELLKYAFEKMGLGGKTNSGYGYFKAQLPEKEKSPDEQGQTLLEKYQKRIESINGRNAQAETNGLLRELIAIKPEIRQATLKAMLTRLMKFVDKKDLSVKAVKKMQEES
jgi:CRISPR-associated protein Cmr6